MPACAWRTLGGLHQGLAIPNSGDGIHCDLSATSCTVRNNTVGYSGGHGIHSSGFPTVIEDCRVSESVANGIDLGQAAVGTTVIMSVSGRNGGAGVHSAAPSTLLRSCHVGTTPVGDAIPNQYGVYLTATAVGSVITDSVVGNNVIAGVLSDASDTLVADSFVGITALGARIPNACGIRLTARATASSIVGSTIGASTADGIKSEAPQTTVLDCFVGLTAAAVPAGNAGNGITLLRGATDSTVASSTVGWNGGNGISTAAMNTSIAGNVVGLFLSSNDAPVAARNLANGVRIYTGGDCSRVVNNTVGHSGSSGVQSWSAGVQIEGNVIGTVVPSAGFNATNHAHGISAEIYPDTAACSRVSTVRGNTIRYSRERATRIFDQSGNAAIDVTEHVTNGWGLGACDLCTCVDEPTQGGVLVRCESPANLGPNFPTSFPSNTVALIMRNTNLTIVDVAALRGMASRLVELDLSFNPRLDLFGLAPVGEQLFDARFSRLEVINLDGTSMSGLRSDSFSAVASQLRLLRLSSASQPPPMSSAGVDLSSAGAALAALPWYSAASCPIGCVRNISRAPPYTRATFR